MAAPGDRPTQAIPRLQVLKALADNTRHAIYVELARSPHPLGTAEIAERLGLHPNTVRPHLDRLREVGLLDVSAEPRAGGVGRPQHRFSLRAGAPALGLEPPALPTLASMLVRLADLTGATGPPAGRPAPSGGGAPAVEERTPTTAADPMSYETDGPDEPADTPQR